MKYKRITALIGASVIMTVLSGCGSTDKKQENELETLIISDMELMVESETESEETETLATETMALDLAEESSESANAEGMKGDIVETELTEAESETAEPETVQAPVKNVKKPGEAVTEAQSETVKESPRKAAQKQEQSESQKETQKQVQSESQKETQRQSETQPASEPEEEQSETEASSELKNTILVINDRVNVRREPSVDAEIQALLTSGMKVLAFGTSGEWTEIRYETENGFEDGYVKSEFLSELDVLAIVSEKINVRAEATTDSEKLGELQANDTVMVVEKMENGWSRIKYTSGNETKDAYVKSEFLKEADRDSLNARIVEEADRLAEEQTESETEAQTEEQTESETEAQTEEQTESETEVQTEEQTEAQTEVQTESETEEQTEAQTEVQTESETEVQTEEQTESETEAQTVTLTEGAKGQFELADMMISEMNKIGIIYSQGNKEAKVQIEEYENLAGSYGVEIVCEEIEEAMDIDLTASELVGTVDCIFCIDDPEVNELIRTVCAYADEVEIPVIGVMPSQVEMGCVAAYADGVLHWNGAEADKLGVGDAAEKFESVKEY